MPEALPHRKLAYTVEEASDLLSLSRAHLYRLIDVGEIGSIQVGRCRRITAGQLDEFVRRHELGGRRSPRVS